MAWRFPCSQRMGSNPPGVQGQKDKSSTLHQHLNISNITFTNGNTMKSHEKPCHVLSTYTFHIFPYLSPPIWPPVGPRYKDPLRQPGTSSTHTSRCAIHPVETSLRRWPPWHLCPTVRCHGGSHTMSLSCFCSNLYTHLYHIIYIYIYKYKYIYIYIYIICIYIYIFL